MTSIACSAGQDQVRVTAHVWALLSDCRDHDLFRGRSYKKGVRSGARSKSPHGAYETSGVSERFCRSDRATAQSCLELYSHPHVRNAIAAGFDHDVVW